MRIVASADLCRGEKHAAVCRHCVAHVIPGAVKRHIEGVRLCSGTGARGLELSAFQDAQSDQPSGQANCTRLYTVSNLAYPCNLDIESLRIFMMSERRAHR